MAYGFKFAFPTANYDPSTTTHTSISETGGTALAVGDLVMVAVSYVIAGDTTMSVADDLGNTFTENTTAHIFNATDNNTGVRFFYCFVTTGGTSTITATAGAAASFFGVFATVYDGVASFQLATTDLRTSSGTAGTDKLLSNAGMITTTPAMLWSFAVDANIANGDRMTAGTGATLRLVGQKANGLADFVAMQDQRLTVNGSVTAKFTLAQGGSAYHCVFLAFTEIIVGPTISTHPADATRYASEKASFTLSAITSGGALSYQWQDDRTGSFANVPDGSGATSAVYTTESLSVRDNRNVLCLVTDDNGTNPTNSANLKVIQSGGVPKRRKRWGGRSMGVDAREWW